MCSKKQQFLPGLNKRTVKNALGGELNQRRRKCQRPFDPKQALHVVLRSSKARGQHSMLRPVHCNRIEKLLEHLKQRWNVRVYRYANVGNHLHLLIRAKSRKDWQGFIRELSGKIAMIVTGARKGNSLVRSRSAGIPESAKRGFWDYLVFTRIVSWRRDFNNVAQYVCKNLWEVAGVPVRRILERGFKILEISEDGVIIVPISASPEIMDAFEHSTKAVFRKSEPYEAVSQCAGLFRLYIQGLFVAGNTLPLH